jgi:hypothetical protein
MKALKISLAILVVAAIGFFVWKAVIVPPPTPKVNAPKNQFTDKIEMEIAAIAELSDTQFSKEAYNDIKYLIDNHYKANRLGKNQTENDLWKENLSKNLYAAYSARFIKQAFVVFRGSEWGVTQLAFIRQEKNLLASSPFLEKPSPVNDDLMKIQQILSKYDEIAGFIEGCRSYKFSTRNPDLSFPTTESKNRIARAKQYLNSSLGNAYVNNCTRLHQGLSEVNEYMFNAHIKYLQDNIYSWIGKYKDKDYCSSQKDYAVVIYNPLKNELNMLDNEVYYVVNFDSEYSRLKRLIDNDSKDAFNYFRNNR